MNYLEQSLDWLHTHIKTQKTSLFAGLLLIGILTACLIYWLLSPGYGVLFTQLDAQDANTILTQLEKSNIPYQLRNHGSDILIDKKLVEKTRIKLMGTELGLTQSIGFELFDKSDFGMTDFSQKINYQRALQGELERTISSLEEVRKARVQLVIPEQHLFAQENNLPRAAVTLHLNRALTRQQIRSIKQLITASVAHLPAQNVVIVDQNGNGLTQNEDDPSDAHFNNKKAIERYLNDKVLHMLARIYSTEQVLVKIDATLNYDELQRERIKPQSGGLITHEKEISRSSIDKVSKKSENQDITREKSYALAREKEHFTRANGTIERLTISVVLPEQTKTEQIGQIERLVKSTVGFDARRGDSISVEALLVENKPAEPMPEYREKAPILFGNHAGGLLAATVLLAASSALVLQLNRRRQRKALLHTLNQWLAEND